MRGHRDVWNKGFEKHATVSLGCEQWRGDEHLHGRAQPGWPNPFPWNSGLLQSRSLQLLSEFDSALGACTSCCPPPRPCSLPFPHTPAPLRTHSKDSALRSHVAFSCLLFDEAVTS